MKNHGQVAQKLKQVKFRHYKAMLEVALEKRPSSCAYNSASQGRVAVCAHKGRTIGPIVCDDSIKECHSMVGSCPLFSYREPVEAIKARVQSEFDSLVSGLPARIASVMPDVAALVWVLDTEAKDDTAHQYDMAEKIASLSSEIKVLEEELSASKGATSVLESMEQEVARLLAEVESRSAEIDQLWDHNAELAAENEQLKSKSSALVQMSRRNSAWEILLKLIRRRR